MTTPTPEQLAEWTNAAQKVWDGQGRMHWVNMDQFDNYVAGYLRAKQESEQTIKHLMDIIEVVQSRFELTQSDRAFLKSFGLQKE